MKGIDLSTIYPYSTMEMVHVEIQHTLRCDYGVMWNMSLPG